MHRLGGNREGQMLCTGRPHMQASQRAATSAEVKPTALDESTSITDYYQEAVMRMREERGSSLSCG